MHRGHRSKIFEVTDIRKRNRGASPPSFVEADNALCGFDAWKAPKQFSGDLETIAVVCKRLGPSESQEATWAWQGSAGRRNGTRSPAGHHRRFGTHICTLQSPWKCCSAEFRVAECLLSRPVRRNSPYLAYSRQQPWQRINRQRRRRRRSGRARRRSSQRRTPPPRRQRPSLNCVPSPSRWLMTSWPRRCASQLCMLF